MKTAWSLAAGVTDQGNMESDTIKKRKETGIDAETFGKNKQADLAAMYEESLKNIKEGSIVKGKILHVSPGGVVIDINYKSEGFVPAEEFPDLEKIQSGDEVEVVLEQIEDDDGRIILSRQKAEQQRMWDNVLASSGEGSILEGEIKSRIRGGMIVDIHGVKAFLPGSQLDILPVRNLDDFIGKRFEFKVMKVDRSRRNIVLSRRELIEQRRREKRKSIMMDIKIGQLRTGTVKNITDFGAFIDLGGLDGLLHITDMSWGRTSHPSKILKVGDSVEVMILDIDFEKERVSLGLKQKTPNPWDNIEQKYPVGSRVHGRVVNLMPYGAFVELEGGVEGLVHISEMSWIQRVGRASDVLSVGDEVDAVVLNINREEQKISLGIRQTTANPWEQAREHYPVGSRIAGTVKNLTSYGAFVELQEGIDGMIHVSDMSWTKKVEHPSELLKKGDQVEVIVLEVSPENQRISLGLKQAQADPWTTIASKYKIGQMVEGTVTKLTSFGAFVQIEEGFEGLVPVSQISDDKNGKPGGAINPEQQVKARVIKIDQIERRIVLSIKAASVPEEEFEVKEEMLAGLKPGEDIVDLAGAFDEAFGVAGEVKEWRPGEKKDKTPETGKQEG
ncbi:MAG: 30S ribosomal protein S1 [Kiritimatiellae bacterium]|nr:30S ribosomal protein S1 [Kiritimatiellia bacterium]